MMEFLKKYIRECVEVSLMELGKLAFQKMDPESNYLLMVEDEQTAQELSDHMRSTFDKSRMPHVVIVVGRGIRVVEFVKKP